MQSCAVKFIRTCLYHHDLSTRELFDLLKKYFTILGSKLHCIKLTFISTWSLKRDLDKQTKGTPKSFERSLDENNASLETTNLRSTGN